MLPADASVNTCVSWLLQRTREGRHMSTHGRCHRCWGGEDRGPEPISNTVTLRDKVDQSSRPLLLEMDERGNTSHRHSSLDNWIIPFRRLTKYYPILIAKQKANATHSLNQSSLKDPVYIQQLLGCMTGQWPFGDGFLRKINSLLFRFLWVLQEWATDVYKIKGCKQQT